MAERQELSPVAATRVGGIIDLETVSSGLRRGGDGIWYGQEKEAVSYPAEGYERCSAVEEGSFWFLHRNRCIVAAVRTAPPPLPGPIFDVGGGNGFVALALAKAGYDVVLVEPGSAGARNAKRRGLQTVVCSTFEAVRFAPDSLPACGLFDVVEHVRNDVDFLRTVRSRLIPGGRVYLTVPAYSWLWSDEDELAGHFRRYTLASLGETLEAAGLEVSFSTYFFRFLPLPILVARTLPYRLCIVRRKIDLEAARRDHASSRGPLSRTLGWLLASEVGHIERSERMGFGGSCLAVATRRPD